MTLAEFKAWFEGYTEGIDGAPSEKQFKKIKDKVALIDGTVTTYPIFIDRYWQYPHRQWPTYWLSGTTGENITYTSLSAKGSSVTQEWSPQAAMYALGKADAQHA